MQIQVILIILSGNFLRVNITDEGDTFPSGDETILELRTTMSHFCLSFSTLVTFTMLLKFPQFTLLTFNVGSGVEFLLSCSNSEIFLSLYFGHF